MDEVVFKSGLTLKKCLRDMLIPIIILGVLLVIFLASFIIPDFISINSEVIVLIKIVSGFFLFFGSLFLLIGFIIYYISVQKIARINGKGLQIPISGYKGFFFDEHESEGYCWYSRDNFILISSSFQNIKKARVVTDKNEIESITTNRALSNTSTMYTVTHPSLKSTEIRKVRNGVSLGELAKRYHGIINDAFKYSHVNVPEKTVAIHFKEMKPMFFGSSRPINESTKRFNENLEKVMPVLKDPVLYVSVANPIEFSNEINRRIPYRQ
ncbi:MAG: hypothetical protein ACOCQG_04905 [Candidatus Nanoarchaeia archaeon]